MNTVFRVSAILLALMILLWFLPNNWICGDMPGSMCWGYGWRDIVFGILVLGTPIVGLVLLGSGVYLLAQKLAQKGDVTHG